MTTSSRIDSTDLPLSDVFKDFYCVPDFQREYVWEESHVEKLLQDVYDEFYGEDGKLSKEGEYFIGSIVTYRDENGIFQLIDGQQRLTTSYLILCAIRDVLHDLHESPPESITNQIAAVSMDASTGEDLFRYRMVLQYEDSQNVLEVIAGNKQKVDDIDIHTSSVEHILNAYQTIREFLQANFDNHIADIKKFAAAYTMRVKLIRIVTPNLSSALKLFETINDRGIGLNSMDLLKNLLFMQTSREEFESLKDLWKVFIDIIDTRCHEKPLRFLRYFILSSYELTANKWEIREDEIYTWFAKNQARTGIDKAPLEFVKDLTKYAQFYANFVAGKNAQGHDNRYLQNIASLSNRARQHFILLLAGRNLPEALFDRLTRNIENLFFCYLITREPTKSFERIFARWSTELREVKDDAGLDGFIRKYILADMANRSNQFDFALRELTSNRIQQYRMRYILAKISQYLDEHAFSKSIPISNYYSSVQIEHILPQWPRDDVKASFDKPEEYDANKIRLGNLTLLEKSINASISNGSFDDKKAGYGQSHFYLTSSIVKKTVVGADTQINRATQDLIQFDAWNSASILLRQEMIGKLARKVWELPQPDFTA
jgi:uncharacterized protein with ParB-like and HNH nuclease domain